MRFDKLDIQAFGEFHQRSLDFSKGNISLVYGRNELGKSTLLSLMRSVCFDYKKRVGENSLFARGAAQAKGSVDFRLRDGRAGSVCRAWDVSNSSPVGFYAELSGDELTKDLFKRDVLNGLDRDFFSAFFGFSYADIATGEKRVASSNLTRLIYGLSFGDPDQVERVKTSLKKRLDELFYNSTASTKLVNVALKRYEEAQTALAADDTKEYKRIRKEIEDQRFHCKKLLSEKEEINRQKGELETLEKAWTLYVASKSAALELQKFDAENQFDKERLLTFAEKYESDYCKMKEKRDAKEIDVQNIEKQLDELTRERDLNERNLKPEYVEHAAEIGELALQAKRFQEGRAGLTRRDDELAASAALLRNKLVEIGVVETDASEERLDAVFAQALRPLAAATLDEATRGADAEKGLQDSLQKSKIFAAEARTKAQAIRLERDALLAAFDDEFKGDKRDVERALEKTSTLFATLEDDYADFENNLRERARAIYEVETEAQRLARLACNDDCSDLPQLLARLEDAKILSDPLGLDRLREEYDAEGKLVENKEKERDAVNAKIDDITRQIKELAGDDEYEKIEIDRQVAAGRRDILWNSIKAFLESGGMPLMGSFETIAKEVKDYEQTVDELDELQERRFLYAASQGKLGVLRGQLKEYKCVSDRLLEDLRALMDSRADLATEAAAILAKYGFDFCSKWKFGVSLDWIDDWRIYRERRAEIEKSWSEVVKRATKNVAAIDQLLTLAKEWEIPGADAVRIPTTERESVDPRVMSALFLQIKNLTSQTRLKLIRYDESFKKLEKLEEILRQNEETVQKYDAEAVSFAAELESLDAKRKEFCDSNALFFVDAVCSSWRGIRDALKNLNEWRDEALKLNVERDKFDRLVAEYEGYDALASKLAVALNVKRSSASRFIEDATLWNQEKDAARVAKTKFEEKVKVCEMKRAELTASVAQLRKLDDALAALEKRSGVESDEFDAFRAAARRCFDATNAVATSERDLANCLGEPVGSHEYQSKLSLLDAADDQYEIRRRLEETTEKAKELETEYGESSKRVGSLEKELEKIGGGDERLKILEDAQRSLVELRARVEEYAPIQLAHAALDRSLTVFENERIPNILAIAERFFKSLTGGRYLSIERVKSPGKPKKSVDLDDFTFNNGENVGFRTQRAIDKEYRYPSQLSQGTREQLYLALRLALVDEYCGALGREPLPILADDVLVQFDDERARCALELFKEIAAADESRQFILMTHHESTRQCFSEIVGEEAIVDLS